MEIMKKGRCSGNTGGGGGNGAAAGSLATSAVDDLATADSHRELIGVCSELQKWAGPVNKEHASKMLLLL